MRRTLSWLPILIILTAGVVVGSRHWSDRSALAAAYARAERALAAGDYETAIAAFAAAGAYRDAAARRQAVLAELGPYRAAYLEGVAALDAGRYDAAIAALLPVARALPAYQDVLALLEEARQRRDTDLLRQAELAIARRDWLAADHALTQLLAADPANGEVAQRLAGLRHAHAPILFTRDSALSMIGPDLMDERLITAAVPVAAPAWSPDRSRIAFFSPDPNGWMIGDLYVVDADGTDLQRVAERALMDWWPAWSPDGTKLAYTSAQGFRVGRERGTSSIRVIDLAAGTETDLTTGRLTHVSGPSWSPDGKRLAFVSFRRFVDYGLGNARQQEGEIYVATLATGELTSVSGRRLLGAVQASWSPVDDRVLVYSVEPGKAWYERRSTAIHLLDLPSGTIEPLTSYAQRVGRPFWAPDGRRFAYVEGEAVVKVRWLPGRREASIGVAHPVTDLLTWSPDGTALLVVPQEPGRGCVLIPLADGPGAQVDLPLTFDLAWPHAGPPQWSAAKPAPLPSPVSIGGTALDPPASPVMPTPAPAAPAASGG